LVGRQRIAIIVTVPVVRLAVAIGIERCHHDHVGTHDGHCFAAVVVGFGGVIQTIGVAIAAAAVGGGVVRVEIVWDGVAVGIERVGGRVLVAIAVAVFIGRVLAVVIIILVQIVGQGIAVIVERVARIAVVVAVSAFLGSRNAVAIIVGVAIVGFAVVVAVIRPKVVAIDIILSTIIETVVVAVGVLGTGIK
jgi:hypothetical protein